MVDYMKDVAKERVVFTSEERNLLLIAYKNVIGCRRTSWKNISLIENGQDPKNLRLIQSFKKEIETELFRICSEILDILKNDLIPFNNSTDAKVFFYKMVGDYYRYLAEILVDRKKEFASKALEGYQNATKFAESKLSATDPLRLGLALNFSVFYYEILNLPDKACLITKESFADALSHIDEAPEETYVETKLLMQHLRDNLTLWTSSDDYTTNIENTRK